MRCRIRRAAARPASPDSRPPRRSKTSASAVRIVRWEPTTRGRRVRERYAWSPPSLGGSEAPTETDRAVHCLADRPLVARHHLGVEAKAQRAMKLPKHAAVQVERRGAVD